jgi:hypothetical protein
MNTGRIDFYTKVHKGLRANLFQLSQRAAALDYADPQAIAMLQTAVWETLARLSRHAVHESRFIHPLLMEKTGESFFDAEHESLEAEQAQLEQRLTSVGSAAPNERRALGLAFYRALKSSSLVISSIWPGKRTPCRCSGSIAMMRSLQP